MKSLSLCFLQWLVVPWDLNRTTHAYRGVVLYSSFGYMLTVSFLLTDLKDINVVCLYALVKGLCDKLYSHAVYLLWEPWKKGSEKKHVWWGCWELLIGHSLGSNSDSRHAPKISFKYKKERKKKRHGPWFGASNCQLVITLQLWASGCYKKERKILSYRLRLLSFNNGSNKMRVGWKNWNRSLHYFSASRKI